MENTIVLIFFGILGALFCFGGYSLRRFLPAILGLTFGFMLGVYIKALYAATEVVRVGNLTDIMQLMNTASTYVDQAIVQAFRNVPDEALQVVWNYLDKGWLVLPIVLAVVFCLMGAKFYRTTAALSAAFTVYFYADVALVAAGNTGSMTAALIAGLVTFLAVLLLYNALFILVSAAVGSTLLVTVAHSLTTIPEGTAKVILIVLFIVGIIVQAAQLISHKKPRRA